MQKLLESPLIPLCPQESAVLQDCVNNVSWKCINQVDY